MIQLRSKSRDRHIADAKKLTVGIIYRLLPGIHPKEVAGTLNVDRTTVYALKDTCYALYATDKDFKKHYDRSMSIVRRELGDAA